MIVHSLCQHHIIYKRIILICVPIHIAIPIPFVKYNLNNNQSTIYIILLLVCMSICVSYVPCYYNMYYQPTTYVYKYYLLTMHYAPSYCMLILIVL